MSGNRSLDEFAGAEPDDPEPADEPPAETHEPSAETNGPRAATDEPAAGAESGENPAALDDDSAAPDDDRVTADDPAPAEDAVDRPASTYAWSPDGAPCDACGATVEERWRDGDDLVCAGCKEW